MVLFDLVLVGTYNTEINCLHLLSVDFIMMCVDYIVMCVDSIVMCIDCIKILFMCNDYDHSY